MPETQKRLLLRLHAGFFRHLNEQLYTCHSSETNRLFSSDPSVFAKYHELYRTQVEKWPENPLLKVISELEKLPNRTTIADFGCGDALLARTLKNKRVYSFDHIASNEYVTPCDMMHVPLNDQTVDVVVFSLSLMGKNLSDYISEAHRVAKPRGKLRIVEVKSRFESVSDFVSKLANLGWRVDNVDHVSNNVFIWIRAVKQERRASGPVDLRLLPCLYKCR
ncbi:ribosomal RNA-processing protein 8-like [Schistocerca gregaria]|uniref:ribosomal RNA-processing protein 8-like n=1 Tax=Schistocerca gregaria TaxID=7010 RepID=UPI00211E3AE7|nr:ribosomal RNA-processing protein 8-like [Schistocerca gregaria]